MQRRATDGEVIQFKVEWLFSDVTTDAMPRPQDYPVHFVFLIRFLDIELGQDHVTHFCFNVISLDAAHSRGIHSVSRRGHVIRSTFNYADIVRNIEEAVASAMASVSDDHARQRYSRQPVLFRVSG